MGSLQQTALGVICLTAAFMFGHYVRTHPAPDSLSGVVAENANETNVSAAAFGGVQQVQPPSLPAPSAGFGVTVPPVQKRDIAAVTGLQTSTRPAITAERPRLETPSIQIDVPDFSQLAASFNNTPLALNPSDRRTNSNIRRFTPVTPPPLVPSNSELGPDLVVSVPRSDAMRDTMGMQHASRMDLRGLRPEKVAPPQPMDSYELKAWSAPSPRSSSSSSSSSFNRDDFQPKLIDNVSAREFKSVENKPPRAVRDDTPPMPELAREPTLAVVVEPQPETRRRDNQLHSYYDAAGVGDRFSRRVFETVENERDITPLTPTDAEPANRAFVTKRPSIPFGLNEEGQNELARIRSRQETNIELTTQRFKQHTTRTGESLQEISTRYYGKPDFYLDIYLANQRLLRNPADIPAGVQLQIPVYQ